MSTDIDALEKKFDAFMNAQIEPKLHHDREAKDYAYFLDGSVDYWNEALSQFEDVSLEDIEPLLEVWVGKTYDAIELNSIHSYFGDGTETIGQLAVVIAEQAKIYNEMLREILDEQESEKAQTLYNMIYLHTMASLEWFFSRCFAMILIENTGAKKSFLEKALKSQNIKCEIRLDHEFKIVNPTEIIAKSLQSNQFSWNNIETIRNNFKKYLNLDISMRGNEEVVDGSFNMPNREYNLEKELEKRNHLAHRFGYDLNNNDVRPKGLETLDFVGKSGKLVMAVTTKLALEGLPSNLLHHDFQRQS